MTPFKQAGFPAAAVDEQIEMMLTEWRAGRFVFPDGSRIPVDEADARRMFRDLVLTALSGDTWINDTYQVTRVSAEVGPGFPAMWHLSIKRRDKQPIHDWRDLQEIKNLLVGHENEAIELYPAESRRVDSANQFHLWALKDASLRLPFGFTSRLVTSDTFGNAKQRPLKSA